MLLEFVLLLVALLALAYVFPPAVEPVRGVFSTLFLLPLNALFVLQVELRMLYFEWFVSAPKEHAKRVAAAQEQVKEIAAARKAAQKAGDAGANRMVSARPWWQTMGLRRGDHKKNCKRVDLMAMRDVLSYDAKRGTVTAEPLVNVGQLSKYLAKRGAALAVLPELDELTIGGLLMGCGIESSSHIYGMFAEIVCEVEVLLADGRVVTCSRTGEHSDLFFALPWSHGTLGFALSLTMKTVPAQRYVHLKYYPTHKHDASIACFSKYACLPKGKAPQFVEGLMYNREEAVVMTGEMVDEAPRGVPVNRIGAWHAPWFYSHVESILDRSRAAAGAASGKKEEEDDAAAFQEEVIPLRDYLHRHTKSLFWEMRQVVPFGNHPLYRWIFGLFPTPRIAMIKLLEPDFVHKLVLENTCAQDVLVPMDALSKTIKFFDDELSIYPLWLCAHRLYQQQGFLRPQSSKFKDADGVPTSTPGVATCETDVPFEMFVDVGAYGAPQKKPYDYRIKMPRMEKFVGDNGGFQMLYARTMLSEDAFHRMFDHSLNDKIRDRYAGDAFPSIYEKISDEVTREANRPKADAKKSD